MGIYNDVQVALARQMQVSPPPAIPDPQLETLRAKVSEIEASLNAKRAEPYERELIRRLGRDCPPVWDALARYGAAGDINVASKGSGLHRYRVRQAVQKLWQHGHLELHQDGPAVRYRAIHWKPGQRAVVAK